MINTINSIQKCNQPNFVVDIKKRNYSHKTDSYNFKGNNAHLISQNLDYRARYLTLSLDQTKKLCQLPYGVFDFKKKEDAWKLWQERITDQIKKKLSFQDRLKVVNAKEIQVEAEKVAAKQEVEIKFIKPQGEEKAGKITLVPNAIMLQGKSQESKNELLEWIPQKADAILRNIKHDPKNPDRTIEEIYVEAEKAENSFKNSRTRTILHVNNIEHLLSDKTDEGERRVADFKAFIQDCSKDYHTTVLFDIKNHENVDPAAIAPHRVGVRIELNKSFTAFDQQEKELCKDTLEAYDIIAKKGEQEWVKYKNSLWGMINEFEGIGCDSSMRHPSGRG